MLRGRIKGFALACVFATFLTACGVKADKVAEGMQLIEKLDYAGALVQFNEAEAMKENERLISRGRGIAYMGLAKYEEAIPCFVQALTSSNGLVENIDYDLNYYLAAAYAKNNQFAEAEKCYDAILALRAKEKEAYFMRGNVRMALGKYEDAKNDFDRVVSMDEKDYDRMIDIYLSMESYGKGNDGKVYLQRTIEKADKQMGAFNKGRIYYYLGEYQSAAMALEEAKDKGGAESYLYLGKAYEATGDYNYASSVYNGYLSKNDKNADIYNQLGVCEMKKGEYQKALEAFLEGKQIADNTNLQSISFNEVVAYEYLGEFEKARMLIENYLRTYPDDENAKREMEFLKTR